jgi:hypothetical protein
LSLVLRPSLRVQRISVRRRLLLCVLLLVLGSPELHATPYFTLEWARKWQDIRFDGGATCA